MPLHPAESFFREEEKRVAEARARDRQRYLKRLGIECKQCGGGQMVPSPKGGQMPCPRCRKRREKAHRKMESGRKR